MSRSFARQISLPEIGTSGQARIEASTSSPGRGDARALAVALDYLARAGGGVGSGGDPIDVPDRAELEDLAGRPELVEAAAFVAGSLAATARLMETLALETRVVIVPKLSEGGSGANVR